MAGLGDGLSFVQVRGPRHEYEKYLLSCHFASRVRKARIFEMPSADSPRRCRPSQRRRARFHRQLQLAAEAATLGELECCAPEPAQVPFPRFEGCGVLGECGRVAVALEGSKGPGAEPQQSTQTYP